MPYFNFGDMKAARQVSRDFYGMIETYKRFKDARVLLLESPLYDQNFLQTSDVNWRGVRIDVNKLRGQAWKIPNAILNNVQFVCLCTEELHSAPPVTDLRNVLSTTPKISHLHFPFELFLRNLNVVFRCPYVKENLKDLKRLDILGQNSHCSNGSKNCLPLLFLHDWEDFAHILINFDHLASILQRLESLHIPTVRISHQDHQRQIETTIRKLLQRNCETLRELSLHFRTWDQDDFCAVKFPRLKTLTLSVKRTDQGALKDFLANKDALEELDVTVKEEFGLDLLDVIKQRCCPNLKKLHLKAKKFVDVVGGSEQIMDWTFLGTIMTKLRDFQLTRPYYHTENWQMYGNGTRLLESLPRNQLKRLGFRGIGNSDCGFWRLNELEEEPELPYKLFLFSGFRNLKRLSFNRCPDAVDDYTMQFIMREMKSLEEYEVTHCSRLTDAGLAGTHEGGSDSIRNLKGQLSEFKVLIKSCLC